MSKKRIHYFASMLLAAMLTCSLSFPAFAARIAFSDPSGKVGDEITVSMKISGSEGETINSSDVMLSYDSSALEFISGTGATGGAGSVRVVGNAEDPNGSELSFSLKFKALKAGSSQIKVSTQEVYDKDSQMVAIDREGSSAVTITGSTGASADASLSELQISPGSLSPSFSADVTQYTATVGSDVEKITVSAASANAQADVSVSGNENLQIGDNQVVCKVTAPDGKTVKTYTIQVTKVEGTVSEEQTPQEENTGVQLKTPERLITVLPASEGLDIPEGFTSCEVSIDGHDVQGWIWGEDQNPSYCVFYAMNENGEKDFYRYDLTEKTLQRYFRDPAAGSTSNGSTAAATADEYNSLLKDYNMRFWIIIGLIALSVVLLIVIIVLVATRGSRDDFFERADREEDYPHKAARARKEKAARPVREEREHRRLSREDQYLEDLEREEESYLEEPESKEQNSYVRDTQRAENTPVRAERPRRPETTEYKDGFRNQEQVNNAERTEQPKTKDDDDDLEFVDLGL